MLLKVSCTYETITPESAELGDADDRGFKFQDETYTAREVIELIIREGYSQLSDSSCGWGTWISTYHEVSNYQTGETISYSLHIENRKGEKLRADQLKRIFKAAQVIK